MLSAYGNVSCSLIAAILSRVNDRILSANGVSFESIDYSSAVDIIKNAEHINMVGFHSGFSLLLTA